MFVYQRKTGQFLKPAEVADDTFIAIKPSEIRALRIALLAGLSALSGAEYVKVEQLAATLAEALHSDQLYREVA